MEHGVIDHLRAFIHAYYLTGIKSKFDRRLLTFVKFPDSNRYDSIIELAFSVFLNQLVCIFGETEHGDD